MLRVLLESPYAGNSPLETGCNEIYARFCMHDCLINHREAPFASHLLYTQPYVLRDNKPEERELGIEAGLLWGGAAWFSVCYMDRGITTGMHQGIARAAEEKRIVLYRLLPRDLFYAYRRACDALEEALCTSTK